MKPNKQNIYNIFISFGYMLGIYTIYILYIHIFKPDFVRLILFIAVLSLSLTTLSWYKTKKLNLKKSLLQFGYSVLLLGTIYYGSKWFGNYLVWTIIVVLLMVIVSFIRHWNYTKETITIQQKELEKVLFGKTLDKKNWKNEKPKLRKMRLK